MDIIRPPLTGRAPPLMPLPAPLGTTGNPVSVARRRIMEISSLFPGKATASGMNANLVASVPYSARFSLAFIR